MVFGLSLLSRTIIRRSANNRNSIPTLLLPTTTGLFYHHRRGRFIQTLTGLLLTSSISTFQSNHYLFSRSAFLTTTTTSTSIMSKPSPPYPYRATPAPTVDLSSLGGAISKADEKRQEAFTNSRKIQIYLVKTRNELESNTSSNTESSPSTLAKDLKEMLMSAIDPTPNNRVPREANLGLRVEEYVRLEAFRHFLETGSLLSPSQCTYATDEEYLAGGCMGLCQDLARYGLGRATARDVESVTMARNLVQELMDYLLQFDFRNGYLRRKYDGTKYALKALETILYELSVTGSNEASSEDTPDSKRAKVENMPHDELKKVRERLEHRDDIRETLIKKCRDAQKSAKQAIFALHRKDANRASKMLKQCEDCIIRDLAPIVQEEPPLRPGSFAAVMEEYAEAKLFFLWLVGPDFKPSKQRPDLSKPNGTLMRPDEFKIHLEPEEYLGGLCDLTGEIGRFAVQRGTVRDNDGVKQCLESNGSIYTAIQTMERFPTTIGKKMDHLRRSVEKLERMSYEMSLSEAAGGRKVDSEDVSMEDNATKNEGANKS